MRACVAREAGHIEVPKPRKAAEPLLLLQTPCSKGIWRSLRAKAKGFTALGRGRGLVLVTPTAPDYKGALSRASLALVRAAQAKGSIHDVTEAGITAGVKPYAPNEGAKGART